MIRWPFLTDRLTGLTASHANFRRASVSAMLTVRLARTCLRASRSTARRTGVGESGNRFPGTEEKRSSSVLTSLRSKMPGSPVVISYSVVPPTMRTVMPLMSMRESSSREATTFPR